MNFTQPVQLAGTASEFHVIVDFQQDFDEPGIYVILRIKRGKLHLLDYFDCQMLIDYIVQSLPGFSNRGDVVSGHLKRRIHI